VQLAGDNLCTISQRNNYRFWGELD